MKTVLFFLFLAVIFTFSCSVNPTKNDKEKLVEINSIDTLKYYNIISVSSSLFLDIEGASDAAGAKLIQYSFTGGENQMFKFIKLRDGYYNIFCKKSSKCLDVSGGSNDNGVNIIQWDPNNGENQKFELVLLADGFYNIVTKICNKCFDVNQNSKDNGAPIIQWDNSNAENQKFKIIECQ